MLDDRMHSAMVELASAGDWTTGPTWELAHMWGCGTGQIVSVLSVSAADAIADALTVLDLAHETQRDDPILASVRAAIYTPREYMTAHGLL